MRIAVGNVADIPFDTCVAIGDGRAIVVRVGDEIRAYRNRCSHLDAALAGAPVRDGLITCPVHQWRYRATDGARPDSSHKLEPFPVAMVNGEAFVMMPQADGSRRRDRLLATDRDDTWPNGITRPEH